MSRKVSTAKIIIIVAFVLLCSFIITKPSNKKTARASLSMLDVGQGDSFLIQSKEGNRVLVDGGRGQDVLLDLSKKIKYNDRYIDVVIATHPDADHIGGLVSVLSQYKVGLFLTSEVEGETETFSNLFKVLNDKNIPSYYVRNQMSLVLGEDENFEFLFPDRLTTNWETNSGSVVGRLEIGKRSVLLAGDSPSSVEDYLAENIPEKVDVDILKLSHHGSKYSSDLEFLKATSPALVLISAGANNHYGHPAKETLDRLKTLNIPSVSTIDHGTVTFYTDGESWTEKDEK